MNNYNPGRDPDRLPEVENSLLFIMDGIVADATMLHGMPELDASWLALQMSLEAFTENMIKTWNEQGQGEHISIGSNAIAGLIETVTWIRSKTEALVDSGKFLDPDN